MFPILMYIAGVSAILGAFRAHFSLGSLVFGLLTLATIRTSKIRTHRRAQGQEAHLGQAFGLFLQSIFAALALLIGTFVMGAVGCLLGISASTGLGPAGALPIAALSALVAGVATCSFLRQNFWLKSYPDPPGPNVADALPASPESCESDARLAKLVGYAPSRYDGITEPRINDATRRPDP